LDVWQKYEHDARAGEVQACLQLSSPGLLVWLLRFLGETGLCES
jgi:hypothetical protein